MVLSSLIFIFIFLPIVLLVYYIVPGKLKNLILLISSLLFYAWGEPIYVIILVLSIIIGYISGTLIEKFRKNYILSKAIFITSIIIYVIILGTFKYYAFFAQNINSVFNLNLGTKQLPLPIGISFFTFSAISYISDVYLAKIHHEKNIINFGAYLSMFTQVTAGPIVKYREIQDQLHDRKLNFQLIGDGSQIFIIGLVKKVVLADTIALVWNSIKPTPVTELSVLSAWIGIIAFTFQIYFDFSGYSDMARGLAKMLGFDITINFNYPYISQNVSEFWRRWHISLGSWFREYIYIPLGGNRVPKIKWYRNLFIVWFLTGLWHGASWNFIMWGLYFGIFVTFEKMFILKILKKLPRFFSHLYTLLVVVIGWVFFEFTDFSHGINFIKKMFSFGNKNIIDNSALYILQTYGLLFILLIIFSTPIAKNTALKYREKLNCFGAVVIPLLNILLLVLSTAFIISQNFSSFFYFKF